MPRFIIIDNASGYVWGDSADLEGAIWRPTVDGIDAQAMEYAAALDAHIGGEQRTYEIVPRHRLDSNATGYHVYRADIRGSEAVGDLHDGQDQEYIDAVVRDCEYVCTIRCAAVDE